MISVTILTKNSQDTLKDTLESLRSFPEVIVLDTGSTDTTMDIAQTFPNVRLFISDFVGFGDTHNIATSHATHDWVLSIDSDEILSEELIKELHDLKLDLKCVYSVQRHNYLNGKLIKWCGGWYPDRVVRLYNRKVTRFNTARVHEKILTDGLKEIELQGPVLHTPYREIADFLSKMQMYTSLYAAQEKERKKGSLLQAIFHGWFAFFKSYVLKKGFLGGREGYIISAYNGHATFYKYLKLRESTRETIKK